jgi:hypothetical protein
MASAADPPLARPCARANSVPNRQPPVRVEGCLGRTSFGFSAFYSSCLTSLPFQPPSTYINFPSSPAAACPAPAHSSAPVLFRPPQLRSSAPAANRDRLDARSTRARGPAESASLDIISANYFPTANRSVSPWTIFPWPTPPHPHSELVSPPTPHSIHYTITIHHAWTRPSAHPLTAGPDRTGREGQQIQDMRPRRRLLQARREDAAAQVSPCSRPGAQEEIGSLQLLHCMASPQPHESVLANGQSPAEP